MTATRAGLWIAGDPDGKRAAAADQGITRLRRSEGEDLFGAAGQAVWRDAERAGAPGSGGTSARPVRHISVADIVDAQSMGKVRAYKKQLKAAAKAAK